MGRKSREKRERREPAISPVPPRRLSAWERADPSIQRFAAIAGGLAAVLTIVGVLVGAVLVVIDATKGRPPDTVFSAEQHPIFRTQFGKLVPDEISQHIPQGLIASDIELFALGCQELERILADQTDLPTRWRTIADNPDTWYVQITELLNQSEYPDDFIRRQQLEVNGETRSEARIRVRGVELRMDKVISPPSRDDVCLYSYVKHAVPFVPEPLFRIDVPSSARSGAVYSATDPVAEEYVGFFQETGTLAFQVDVVFGGPGGYDYSLRVLASEHARPTEEFEVYEGRYRWFQLSDLDGWKLHVDIQPTN